MTPDTPARRISLQGALGEPFVGIAAALALGILINELLTPGLAVSYGAASCALLIWIWRDKTSSIWLFCLAAGGLLHLFQTGADRAAPFFDQLENSILPVEVTGIIVSAPKPMTGNSPGLRFDLQLESIQREGRRYQVAHNKIAVELRGEIDLVYGDRLEMRGRLRKPRPRRNPAAFDYASYLRHRGIYAELLTEARYATAVDSDQGNPLVAFGLRGREAVSTQLTRGLEALPDERRALILAMTLGARDDTPEYIEDKFRFSGTLHVFAVSGLHVGIVASVVWLLSTVAAAVFRFPRKLAILVTIVAVLTYALITGLRPSAVRAAVMASIFFAGMLFDREPQIFNSTGAAAVCILLADTSQLFQPGFQLSFCVLIAIAALATPLSYRLGRPFSRDPFFPNSLVTPGMRFYYSGSRKITGLIAMSIAAWVGSILLTWHYFGLITPVSIIANLLLIPLAFIVLATAAFSVLLSPLPTEMPAIYANEANAFWTGLAAEGAGRFSELPGAHFGVPDFDKIIRELCEITLLDLPYGGSAAHLAFRGGADWLIDTGSDRQFGSKTHPLLRSFAPGRLDGLILTHADSDHVGGASKAIQEYRPRQVIASPYDSTSAPWRRALQTAADLGVPIARPGAGERIEIDGGHTLAVLYPPPSGAPGFVADDRCLVLRLDLADGWRVLFVGDSGFYTGRWLAENVSAADLRCDILVRGTHGDDDSSLVGLLEMADPRAIVLTSRSSRDEVPLPEGWAGNARSGGAHLLDQNDSGAVIIKFSNQGAELRGFLDGQSISLKRAD